MARLPVTMLPLLWAALGSVGMGSAAIPAECPRYTTTSYRRDSPPFSAGVHKLPSMRPSPECRTFHSPEVEAAIDEMRKLVKDPDLFRLFENTWPNTLDTTIAWKGVSAEDPSEELAFITTGDINAMWLRDSANQLQSYMPVLRYDPSPDSLASVFRGAINLQGRYIRTSPYCNAFQPPTEAVADGLEVEHNGWASRDVVSPSYNLQVVFECKYELDSLAAFLQLSHDYYSSTRDSEFFRRTRWVDTVDAIIGATSQLLEGTYSADGKVLRSAFSFSRTSDSASETVSNRGVGAPVKTGTGLVRSFFRPSDDSCTFQLFIPANMMFSRYLEACARIMGEIDLDKAGKMKEFAASIRRGIEKYGRVKHPDYGVMYAYEVDGFGSQALMVRRAPTEQNLQYGLRGKRRESSSIVADRETRTTQTSPVSSAHRCWATSRTTTRFI